jgi:site-specific recombinase XerD
MLANRLHVAMSKTAIISSTADLRFQGKPYPGCPLLLVDGRVEPAPSLWLFWVFRNRRASTADTYAKAIDLWFRALGTSGLRWWEVVPTDLEAFMAGLADAGASANTLRLRAAAVAQFYAWCHANGLIDRVAFTASSGRRHPGDMARAGIGRVSLPKTASRAVKSHTVEQFDAILGGLGRKLDITLRRDELICEAGRYLGLRRSEVAGLRCSQFEDLDPTDEVQPILLDARTTKGGKARAVLAPRLYVQKVQRFIQGYRAEFVSTLEARTPAYRDPGL